LFLLQGVTDLFPAEEKFEHWPFNRCSFQCAAYSLSFRAHLAYPVVGLSVAQHRAYHDRSLCPAWYAERTLGNIRTIFIKQSPLYIDNAQPDPCLIDIGGTTRKVVTKQRIVYRDPDVSIFAQVKVSW